MPRGKGSGPYPISREIVEYVLLGPADDPRQLQDSPILGTSGPHSPPIPAACRTC
jgi:hypothetical protein